MIKRMKTSLLLSTWLTFMMPSVSMAWLTTPSPSTSSSSASVPTSTTKAAWWVQHDIGIGSMRLYTTSSPTSDGEERKELSLSSSSLSSSSSRRQWLNGMIGATIGTAQWCSLPLVRPPTANAADLVTTKSVCDPTVSVWKRNGRLIYLLGTAHISSSSAELAGSLVRDTHPNAVFVELDPKRIKGSGILANRVSIIGEDGQEEESVQELSSRSKIIVPRIITPTAVSAATGGGESLSDGGMVATTTTAATPAMVEEKPKRPNPLLRAGSMAVGNAIKGMYKKMDSAGFNAGEEFVIAIREGQTLGADIVLGDRDVEVTLRRLTEGLAQTDLNALLNPDSDLEKSMKELVPSSMADSKNPVGGGDLTDAQFRDEFSTFVETMKTKENVKKIMGQLQQTAPALYKAMVSERDAYMAAGLNGLNDYEAIVAVVGIAHVDGIESNLNENGWKPCSLRCSAV